MKKSEIYQRLLRMVVANADFMAGGDPSRVSDDTIDTIELLMEQKKLALWEEEQTEKMKQAVSEG